MDIWLTLTEAAIIVGLDVSILQNMCQNGIIRYGILTTGEIIVNQNSLLESIPKENHPEYKKVAFMAGKGISMRAAAKQYGIPHQTISRWVERGIISVLGRDGRKILIDQADIAYCAAIYSMAKETGSRGRWIFDDDGTPYQKLD